MKTIRFLLITLAVFLFMVTAWAAALHKAKAKGWIMEQSNGYVAATANAPAQARQLATSVNAKRRALYSRVAKKEGVSTRYVARTAGRRIRG